jgi:HEAT repeat protein
MFKFKKVSWFAFSLIAVLIALNVNNIVILYHFVALCASKDHLKSMIEAPPRVTQEAAIEEFAGTHSGRMAIFELYANLVVDTIQRSGAYPDIKSCDPDLILFNSFNKSIWMGIGGKSKSYSCEYTPDNKNAINNLLCIERLASHLKHFNTEQEMQVDFHGGKRRFYIYFTNYFKICGFEGNCRSGILCAISRANNYTIDELKQLLESANSEVRKNAIIKLPLYDGQAIKFVPDLINCLNDEGESVRLAASESLYKIGNMAIPMLEEATQKRDLKIMEEASKVLNRLNKVKANKVDNKTNDRRLVEDVEENKESISRFQRFSRLISGLERSLYDKQSSAGDFKLLVQNNEVSYLYKDKLLWKKRFGTDVVGISCWGQNGIVGLSGCGALFWVDPATGELKYYPEFIDIIQMYLDIHKYLALGADEDLARICSPEFKVVDVECSDRFAIGPINKTCFRIFYDGDNSVRMTSIVIEDSMILITSGWAVFYFKKCDGHWRIVKGYQRSDL